MSTMPISIDANTGATSAISMIEAPRSSRAREWSSAHHSTSLTRLPVEAHRARAAGQVFEMALLPVKTTRRLTNCRQLVFMPVVPVNSSCCLGK